MNPMIVSKCSASRVQVDAVTYVGRECGGRVGSAELLSVARLALEKAGAGSEAVKDRDAWIMCWSVSKEPTTICPNSHLSIRIYLHQHRMPLPFLPQVFTMESMDMGTVDAGLVVMESVRGRGEPPRVCSFLHSLSNFEFADRSKGRGGKQVSCVLACCVIDAGARIKEDT